MSYRNGNAALLVLHLLPFFNLWLIIEIQPAESLFYRYYFDRCSFEPAQLVQISYAQGRSNRYSDRLDDFSVIIPRRYDSGILCL